MQNQRVDGTIDTKYRHALCELLYIDTLRGMDSTGVAMIPRDLKQQPYVLKRAIPGFAFVDIDEYKHVWNMQCNPMVVIGHNRAATHGTVTEANAHPFVADHITLVHNGTIRNHHSLNSGVVSGVDSCHIAHAIARHGALPILEQLDGAAVLVWYDKTEHSINIARTKDRSIRWIFDEHGTCWFASEREMLWSVLVRNGIQVKTGFSAADEYTWYKWTLAKTVPNFNDVDMGQVIKTKFAEFVPQWKQDQLKWEAERKARTEAGQSDLGEFPPSNTTGTTRQWTSKNTTPSVTEFPTARARRREEPVSKRKIEKADKKLAEFNLATGDEITVRRVELVRSDKPHLCDIYCLWVEKGLRVILPDVPLSLWDRCASGFYQVLVYNVLKEHIKSKGKHSPLIYAKPKNYQLRDLVQGPGNHLIPKDEFERLAADGCAWCPKPVSHLDHEVIEWINGKPLCRVCSVNFSGNNRILH